MLTLPSCPSSNSQLQVYLPASCMLALVMFSDEVLSSTFSTFSSSSMSSPFFCHVMSPSPPAWTQEVEKSEGDQFQLFSFCLSWREIKSTHLCTAVRLALPPEYLDCLQLFPFLHLGRENRGFVLSFFFFYETTAPTYATRYTVIVAINT